MLKIKTAQNMNKALHKASAELSPQTILHKALQQPLLLAPPPTPTKHRGQSADCDVTDPNSPHFPDHLGCGEVFTWHCEGEFYAVECRLCDDRPLCPLSEFPLHMEAWHTDWSGKLTIDGEDMDEDDDDDQNDLYHVLAMSPLNEDSGLCDYDHEHGFESGHKLSLSSSHEEEEDVLEPFEQVLIEQDNTIGTTQINEEVANAEDEEGLVTEGGTATTTVLIAATATAASSSSPLPNHIHEQQQHHKSKPKQYNGINTNELSIQTLSPLNHSAKEESPNNTAHAGESGDIRELREYMARFNNKEFTLSERNEETNAAEQNKTITNELAEHKAEVTGSWDDIAKESYNDEKQEIPQTAGEMFDPKQQQDLQQFTISFEENVIADTNSNGGGDGDVKKVIELTAILDNCVEIASVEILNISPNVTNTDTVTADNKRGRSSPRKRKSKEKEDQPETANKTETSPETTPQISGKYLKSYEKFLEKTETESASIDSSPSSPSQSPEPKRRRIYCRACKKSPRDAIAEKQIEQECEKNPLTSQGEEQPDESPRNCDTYTFLTPTYSYPSPSSTCTSSISPEKTSSSSDKSGKILCLVKQCERIARDHQSSASSTISSSSSSSTTSPKRSTRRRRRSLTPVEVCDILPTVPLNDHSISIYDTGNLTPQTLSEHLESLACSLLDYDDFPDDDRSVASTTLTSENIAESSPSSPGSPKTEEEHFEFHEPREKLNKIHILKLIELYKEHTRLWDQTHTEFCEPHLCRQSWVDITDRWNVFCKRKFHITEVRIRISTLCQRYLKERERIQREGELDESAKFPYYEQMLFLEQHRSLQKRREVYEQQNEKILEIFQKYLVLWHVRCYKVRQVKERTKAYQCISAELKDIGIYLSSTGVQKRIRSLKKCYRLEKIRHLHAQVERITFESTFKHYTKMQFLDKHIDPFVCRICGKIFETLIGFKEHVETVNHGNILEEEDDDEYLVQPNLPPQDADAVLCGTNEKFQISMGAKDQHSVSVFIKPLAVAQEVEVCTSGTGHDSALSTFPMEDQIIEEIIENVSNEEVFATKTLDKYLHSADSYEDESFYIDSANNSITSQELDHQMADPITVQQEDDPPSDEGATTVTKRREDLPKLDGRRKCNKTKAFGVDEEYHSGDGDTQSARLTDDEIHKMIAIYRKYRQLWDPNHLDYNTRSLRRQAWFALTTEYNTRIHRNFSWRSLYRKLIDYAKYYKKLTAEQSPSDIKWVFYQDLRFLDDVIAVSNELGKSIHQRSTTLNLIEIYRDLPQLWNIRNPDFNKRPIKQRNINIMCNRLQEETNKQINPERIKNRIIELRTQYRADKKKRLRCVNNKQKFFPDFEYYEEFNFIDDHIDPFECEPCCMEFKKLTDFNSHMRKEHEPQRRRFRPVTEDEQASAEQRLDNVCHICGVKFSNRGNLGHHLIRHEGIRNFECSMCPKKFFTSHSLKIHVRTHTKECPYICEKCGLSFVNASKLNQHVLRHTNKKDFKCDHCPKAFYTAFERDRHTRWHLNIRDKDCPICGKSFVKGSSYYAHLMLHSDTKRFECDKCDMKFAQYAGLYKHRKRYHST